MMASNPTDLLEEINNLKQQIADLKDKEETYRRSENLLQAFNQASLAMLKAITPEEIFDTVAETLKGLGLSSIIYSIDPAGQNLIISSITLDSQALRAIEKITGSSTIGYTISIDSIDAFRISIRERRTHLTRDSDGILNQVIPASLKKFGGKIAALLNVPQSINAPLISGDEIVGLLSVQSKELVEEDIPLITIFAHQVASSWQKAKLLQQAQWEINDRAHVESELRREHNRAQRYLDIAGVIIVVLDESGTIELINQKGCDILGYKENELIGENWFEKIIPEYDRENVIATFHQLMRAEIDPVEYYQNPVQTKFGDQRIIAWHNALLTDNGGRITGTLSSGEDITEQLQAEFTLRESEERFRSIVQSSPMGMHLYSLETDGQLIFIGSNPAADEILWVNNAQFIGKTIEEAFPALVDTEIPEIYRRVAADGKTWHTTQITYQDEWISGVFEIYAVQTSPGKMAAIFLDISERKRALEEQERLVNILEASPDVVATATLSGHIIYLNKAGQRMFGLQDEHNLLDLEDIQQQSIKEYLRINQESIDTALLYGIWSGESVIINTSNQEIPVSIVLITHRDEERNPEFISAVIRDITDLHQAEDLILLQSTALDSAASGIYISDDQGKIIWANPMLSDITGYTLEEIIGQSPEMLRLEQELDDQHQGILASLSKDNVWHGELINQRKSGDTYISEQTITPVIDSNENITHYISIQHDISERKRKEGALEQQAARLALLNEIGEKILAVLDLERVYQHAVQLVQENFGYHHVGIFTVDQQEGTLILQASSGGFNDLFPQNYTLKIGQGLVGWVAENYQVVLSNNIASDDRFDHSLLSNLPTRSQVCVPIHLGNQVIGVLDAQSPSEDAFDENDVNVMKTLVDQIAIAIENGRLHAAIKRSLEETQAMATINQALNETLDLDRLLKLMVDSISEIIPHIERVVAHLYDEKDRKLIPAAVAGISPEREQKLQMQDGQGIAGEVIKTGISINVKETEDDPRFIPIAGASYLRSLLVVPVQSGGRRLGTISVSSKIPRTFTDDDERLLTMVGVQAALAISKAKLLDAEQNRRQEAETLRDISAALTATLEIDQVLERILLRLEEAINYDSASVLLLEGDVLTMVAGRGFDGFNIDVGQKLPANSDLFQEIYKSLQPIVIQDVQEDRRWDALSENVPVRSWIGIPLIIQEELIGYLTIDNWKPNIYTGHELRLAQAFGNQASIALQNARLYAATTRRLAESNTLFYISNLIVDSAEPDVEAILHKVVDQLWRDFGYYHVHVYLIDQESGALIANQGSGPIGSKLKEEEYQFTSEEGIVGYAASVGEAFMTNNVNDVLFYRSHPLLPDIIAELAAPLRTRNQILGVLDILHQSPNTFDNDDFRFLTTVADQLAVILDKAMLYKQLQDALHKEQRTRAQLVQTEKLAAMGRLIASVAHELNNPLQAIQNALYLVKMEENLSPQAAEDLQVAFDEGSRMAGLIARLRDTYRPVEASDYQPESVNVLVEEVQKLIGTHLRHNNVTMEFLPNPDLPQAVLIRDQIKQVILNLCINAIESMPQGGKLTIQTDYMPELDEIHIQVSDVGPGISPNVQNRIFEPFFTTKEGGTGLGLAVSYEIAQNHNGDITAKNNSGVGSTFTLSLPCKHPMLE
ncbi:GAF domain-containing protein [Chloroflexota bacterium]